MNKIDKSTSDRPPVNCISGLELGRIARDCTKDFDKKKPERRAAVG